MDRRGIRPPTWHSEGATLPDPPPPNQPDGSHWGGATRASRTCRTRCRDQTGHGVHGRMLPAGRIMQRESPRPMRLDVDHRECAVVESNDQRKD